MLVAPTPAHHDLPRPIGVFEYSSEFPTPDSGLRRKHLRGKPDPSVWTDAHRRVLPVALVTRDGARVDCLTLRIRHYDILHQIGD